MYAISDVNNFLSRKALITMKRSVIKTKAERLYPLSGNSRVRKKLTV